MNTGIVASRYAKALLKYVQENGAGNEVYSQSVVLVAYMHELPQLKLYVEDSADVSLERKISLLSSALGHDLDPSLVRFLELLSQRRRLELLSRMLVSFIEQYRRTHNIKVGRLVTAVPMSGLRERLEEIFAEKMSADVHLEEKVDDSLIGGFVFELDGLRLDASVERQLERLRSQLVEKNNRIV
jgi:F-type H+-transporting ATPase subunit delta